MNRKIIFIFILGLTFGLIALSLFVHLFKRKDRNPEMKIRKENDLISEKYDEKILEDIYVDNLSLTLMGKGFFIEDAQNMYQPTYIIDDCYYYNIKENRQLKIVTDGKLIKGMYYDNLHKVAIKKYKLIQEGLNIQYLEKIVGHVYIFYNYTLIDDPEKTKRENPICEICFNNGMFCRITFDKNGEIITEVSELYSN